MHKPHTKKILIQESEELYFRSIDTADVALQDSLLKGRCVNCKLCPKEGDKIDYVLRDSKVISMWHFHDEITDMSCDITN